MNLLLLSPQSLASLTNWGLVKRAGREIQKGLGPALEQREDGEIEGRFPDGTRTVITPSMTSLADVACTCGAREVCRHRVGLVLAFQAWAASHHAAHSIAAQPSPIAAWTPAQFTDDELRAQFASRIQKQAETLQSKGIVIELLPPDAQAHRSLYEARLPNASVRFHIPGDLSHAQCTCIKRTRCEHVWLAIEAYRRAADPARPQTLRLGPPQAGIHSFPALEDAFQLAAELLITGTGQALPDAWMPRFQSVIEGLKSAGYLWPASILRELADLQLTYHRRSARYSIRSRCALLTELFARIRAARAAESPDRPPASSASLPKPLPAPFILGSDQAPETPLDQARLVSLGAHITGDENEREILLYLADISSGMPLLVRKTIASYDKPKAPGEEDIQLRRMRIAKGLTLDALVHGQIVSRSLKRMADHTLDLGARGAQHTLTSFDGNYGLLPETLLIKDFASYDQHQKKDIPQLLRPRFRAHNMRVLAIAKVEHCAYHPGYQEIRATLLDAHGHALELVRGHKGIAPHALDCIAAVLHRPQTLRFVSGELRRTDGRMTIDPCALVSDRLIVPDLEVPGVHPGEALSNLGEWINPAIPSPHAQTLSQAQHALEDLCHDGLAHIRPGQIERLMEISRDLQPLGMNECAQDMQGLGIQLQRLSHHLPRAESRRTAVEAWICAVIRVALNLEIL